MNFPFSHANIVLVGAGNIAYSIAKGFINKGKIEPKRIRVFAPSNNNLPKFNGLGCFTSNKYDDNLLGKETQKVIFFCVKPTVFRNQFHKIPSNLHQHSNNNVVISVMAGITLTEIKKSFQKTNSSDKIPYLIRIMLTTACAIGHGICAISTQDEDEDSKAIDSTKLLSFLSPLGCCKIIPECQMDVACGLGGSGIAFMYNAIQDMADGGVKMGLPRQTAIEFSAHSAMAAAKMIIESNKHPIELRDQVTSIGGTAIHGLHAYEKAGVSAGLIDAVEAATKRAQELGCLASKTNK